MTAAMSIGDLARRTGVPQATLRTWEARYGLPRAERLPGGHRRYDEGAVRAVEAVLSHRAAGLGMEAAVARARSLRAHVEPSVFAGLRRRHPGLVAQGLSKHTMLALTRAIEDECCARADHAVLFTAFQRADFYEQSAARWEELARTAEACVVFADFPDVSPHDHTRRGRAPLRVPLPADAPFRREWTLVCDSADYPACVAGWEMPGQEHLPDGRRRFEGIWSVDPRVVRDAALICMELTHTFLPDVDLGLEQRLGDTPPPASPDLRRASGLLDRMVAYLETTHGP